MKKFSEILLIACAALFAVGAAFFTVTKDKELTSYYENRFLAELPAASAETLSNGEYFYGLETYLCDHAAGRNHINLIHTALDIKLLNRPVVNGVVVLEDYLLSFRDYNMVDYYVVNATGERLAANLEQLTQITESYGGEYYYVSVPCQYAYFADEYPGYMNNDSEFTQACLDTLYEKLGEKGINFIDIGPVFDALGSPDYFGSTVDSHYSMYGALAAYTAILERINADEGGEVFKIYGEDELIIQPVDEYYMGSRSRKIFNVVKNDEKLYTVEPVEAVPFTRTDNGEEVESKVFHYPEQEWVNASYDFYMGGDHAITTIDTGREEYPSVLIYGDSFTNAMECIFYLSCDEMTSIDLRHYTGSSLSEYIAEHQPDYVICIRSYESLLSVEGNGGI